MVTRRSFLLSAGMAPIALSAAVEIGAPGFDQLELGGQLFVKCRVSGLCSLW
jgi:hypothetical protein